MKILRLVPTFIVALTAATGSVRNGPTVPAWVHPGLVVIYDGLSAFIKDGRPSLGIRIVSATRVASVSGDRVSGVIETETVGKPGKNSFQWTCTAAGRCDGFPAKFWVDPARPVDSVIGPNGERFILMGQTPYSLNGRSRSAAVLKYESPATGWQFVLTFDTKSGLVLQYSETSPGQQVHLWFRKLAR
jgi:hypothetical protein